ncbi:MAG TPA: hypothetical protein VLQ92_07400, partial [Candidatus Limnocylindrales bacterium]|nr:hypothetical protein [Candidatus Limnocylindrales bacterium]
ADQHDTLILTHDTVALPRPPVGAAPPVAPGGYGAPAPGWQPVGSGEPAPVWQSAGWSRTPVYAASAWSHVPPFVPAPVPPLVMRNNAAVVGATLGSVSLFLSLIPLIGIVAWVLAPLGLLSSAIGLVVGATRKVGRVGALWGLLTSGAALVVCLAWMALVLAL